MTVLVRRGVWICVLLVRLVTAWVACRTWRQLCVARFRCLVVCWTRFCFLLLGVVTLLSRVLFVLVPACRFGRVLNCCVRMACVVVTWVVKVLDGLFVGGTLSVLSLMVGILTCRLN